MYSTQTQLSRSGSPRSSLSASPNNCSQNASQTYGLFSAGVDKEEKAQEKPKVKFSPAEVRKQIRILRDPTCSHLHEEALSILNEFVKNEQQPKDNNGVSDVRCRISNVGDVKLWVILFHVFGKVLKE